MTTPDIARRGASALLIAGAAAWGSTAAAAARVEPPAFLRVETDHGASISLETASRRFARADGAGPIVVLVGVSHIGDAAYYEALQSHLDAADLVLYESVKPAGTGGPVAGESDRDRAERTRSAMSFVRELIAGHHRRRERYPADLNELRVFAGEQDSRGASLLDAALLDAWNRPLRYEVLDGEDGPASCTIVSLGADGRPGGEGVDADIRVEHHVLPARTVPFDEGQIQQELATALGLAFQLEAIDYDRPQWRCSDMSIDEIRRSMAKRGSDFTIMEDTLAGTSLPARLVRLLLGLIRLGDSFTDNAMSDTFKVLLMELLADEQVIEASLSQFDDGLADVLIGERNQVVVDDLRRIVETGPEVGTIAVFYGAGHMRDLTARLGEQMGLEPVDARWFPAISVDLTQSAVSESQVRQLRAIVRRTLRQMAANQAPRD